MHWKGLRVGTSDGHDSKRHTVVDPRRSEQLSRPTLSTTEVPPRRSESAPRHLAESDENAGPLKDANDPKLGNPMAALSHSGTLNSRRNRFSFMKLRHASDPQLSRTYAKGEEDVPPVPSLPPPPTIITTAPTSHDIEPVKRQNKLKVFARSKDPSREELPAMNPNRKPDTQESRDSLNADSGEEPIRLSTNSARSARGPSDSQRSSGADLRFSESSRSDQSLGDRGIRRANSPREGKRFRMPRLKRNRAPLFPLPPKPETGLPQSAASRSDVSDDNDHVSALPSPARSAVGLAGPTRSRRDSTTSARSANSNSSPRPSASKRRERSSTMDSLADPDQQPSPYLASSARTSTSTSGRKSFGDIFSFSQRFRQNSEPPLPRNGSPGVGPGTPVSKQPSGPPPYPAREEGDTPATYLTRLRECVPKGSIASILSLQKDEFHKTALRKYMRGFSFFGDPIDMAIRKLLMEVELPKETQQIDRFLQSFADRYHECNPGVFASPDQAYFIAFSILILHTDVFNKNNKRKMQKPDYVKNTRGEGISEDILECFYDNIAYTPFIHIEGANLGPRHLAKPRRGLLKSVSSENLTRPTRDPVDPYALILDGKLDSLRPSLKDVMDLDDTYSCTGSSVPDMDSLHQRFAKSGILQIVSARSRPDAFTGNPADASPGLVDIKVAKVGLLWRKDPKKKRTRSPWQEWGALLTFSQLYFFRDVNWVKSLMSQHGSQQKYGRFRTVVFKPPLTDFKPDGIMSTDDAVALLDAEYKRHKHAFLFVRRNSLEEVFLANSEADRDDWLAMLNYAAAFRTTGVRTKGMIAPNYEGRRYRLSRVASDSSLADREPPSPMVEADVAEELVNARKRLMSQRILEANEKLFACERQLDDLLRNARHLQTLTPVHARAREQVIMAAGRMAAKLKWARQDIWRTRCYKEVLVRDLGEEPTRFIEPGFLHLGTTIRESAPTSPVERTESNEIPKDGSLREISEEIDKITQRPPSDRRSSVPALAVSPEADSMKRHHSADNVKRTGSSAARLEREPSVLSSGSRMDVSSLGSRGSKLASPSSIDDGEERLLREAGLLEVGSSPPEKDERAKETSRVRRSLHRTLRDTRHTRRGSSGGKKARDSVSSAPEDEGKEGGGLSRKTPSFTVHGKKASIVTFGTEWQTMPPGERLKLRKPTPSEDRRTSDSVTGDSATFVSAPSERSHEPAQSLRSASTATRRSRQEDSNAGGVFGEIDPAPGHTAGRNNPDADTVSPTRAHTSNGRLAVPSEDAPASASSDEAADQEKIQHSPPEQAVSA